MAIIISDISNNSDISAGLGNGLDISARTLAGASRPWSLFARKERPRPTCAGTPERKERERGVFVCVYVCACACAPLSFPSPAARSRDICSTGRGPIRVVLCVVCLPAAAMSPSSLERLRSAVARDVHATRRECLVAPRCFRSVLDALAAALLHRSEDVIMLALIANVLLINVPLAIAVAVAEGYGEKVRRWRWRWR